MRHSVGTGASVDAKESTQENSASDKSANISSAQLPELKAHLKSDADINEPSNNMKPASRSHNHVSSNKAPHSEAKANTKSEIKIRTTKMPTASEIEAMKAQLAKRITWTSFKSKLALTSFSGSDRRCYLKRCCAHWKQNS